MSSKVSDRLYTDHRYQYYRNTIPEIGQSITKRSVRRSNNERKNIYQTGQETESPYFTMPYDHNHTSVMMLMVESCLPARYRTTKVYLNQVSRNPLEPLQ